MFSYYEYHGDDIYGGPIQQWVALREGVCDDQIPEFLNKVQNF